MVEEHEWTKLKAESGPLLLRKGTCTNDDQDNVSPCNRTTLTKYLEADPVQDHDKGQVEGGLVPNHGTLQHT